MKIVQLSTYPTILPRHGGQIRVSQIAHFLRLNGHQVRCFSVCEPTHKQYSADDVVVSKKDLTKSSYPPCVYDYAISFLGIKDPYYELLKTRIVNFDPEVVIIEQVWLYPFYKMLYAECKHKPILIYSSHNIEFRMKSELLKALKLYDQNLIADIERLEKELCCHADHVIACTVEDEKSLIEMGAKNVILCANGVEKIRPKNQVNQLLGQLLGQRSYALFVGSAHAPNAIGFWEMLSDDLSYLKPDQIIIVAGSVSHILQQYAPKSQKFNQLIMDEKIKLLGEVSEDVLASLLENAQVILLPITVGGGSSLKSAEAIVANRPTVATRTAIRGFEFATTLSQFVIAERQEDFIAGIKQAFASEVIALSKQELELRGSLFWGLTLEPINQLLQQINSSKSGSGIHESDETSST